MGHAVIGGIIDIEPTKAYNLADRGPDSKIDPEVLQRLIGFCIRSRGARGLGRWTLGRLWRIGRVVFEGELIIKEMRYGVGEQSQ